MKGQEKIIAALNDVLSAELTAINQYFIHAEMCENWGYGKLHAEMKGHSIGEMKHAERVMARILYLEGTPNMSKYMKIQVGRTLEEMHQFDLALEKDAVARLNAFVTLAAELGDNGSKDVFQHILEEEEEHIDWIESQIDQIAQMGIQNYLATKV